MYDNDIALVVKYMLNAEEKSETVFTGLVAQRLKVCMDRTKMQFRLLIPGVRVRWERG